MASRSPASCAFWMSGRCKTEKREEEKSETLRGVQIDSEGGEHEGGGGGGGEGTSTKGQVRHLLCAVYERVVMWVWLCGCEWVGEFASMGSEYAYESIRMEIVYKHYSYINQDY
jgi:hypothetical protein